jgi:hypothetical protein
MAECHEAAPIPPSFIMQLALLASKQTMTNLLM